MKVSAPANGGAAVRVDAAISATATGCTDLIMVLPLFHRGTRTYSQPTDMLFILKWCRRAIEEMTREPIVGCCGWTEAQARYFEHFPAIEIQTTFYEPPSIAVAKRWKEQAPRDFQFCMKAWQLITHTPTSPTYRKLKEPVKAEERDLYGNFRPTERVQLAWERTREIAKVLDAAVIVFQCPNSFLPTAENLRNIDSFFEAIEREHYVFAWELRGEDWTPDIVRRVCRSNDLVHCVDPFQSAAVYGDTLYWRLHGRGGYRYKYTDEDLSRLRTMLAAHMRDRNYVLFNNMTSRQDALRFSGQLYSGVEARLATRTPRA